MTSHAIASLLLRYNRHLLAALLVAVIALCSGLPKVQLSDDNRAFFGEDNPELINLRHLDDTYTLSNSFLLMVVPTQGAAFDPKTLTILRTLSDELWYVPFALRVDSPLSHMRSFSQGGETFVEPLLDEFEDITPQVAQRFKSDALKEETLKGRLLAQDGSAYGFSVRVVFPKDEPNSRRDVEAHVRDVIAMYQAENPDWGFHLTGGFLSGNLLVTAALQDIVKLVPLALLLVVILLALFLRSFLAVLATIIVLVIVTVSGFGFAGWSGIVLTAGTAISPLAIMVLVSTSCVHVILSWSRAQHNGTDDAFTDAIADNLAPVTVSHLTTAFGFLCLNFAPSPPFREMGNIVAFGLIFGLAVVFIILPAFFRNSTRAPKKIFLLSPERMRRLSQLSIQHPKRAIIGFIIASVVAVFGISRIGFDDTLIHYFDDRYEFRRDGDLIQQQLTGLESMQFSFQAPEGASLFDPEFLNRIDKFTSWLETQPNVVNVTSIPNVLSELNQSLNDGDPDYRRLADSQAGNAQLMMMYELSLPIGMDLNALMDVDRTQTLVSATIRAEHSRNIRALGQSADVWLATHEPSIHAPATGLSLAFARISEQNNQQMLFGLGFALLLVSCILVLTLRSLRFGLISIIPNLTPALLAFGLWGLTLRDVNLGSTVVTTMTFGIVVDDTVHFLVHYLRNRRKGQTVPHALEDTFSVIGSSIIITTLALVSGFMVMALSGFAINQHVGLLTSIVIGFALICDMFFLPPLLLKLDRSTHVS